jgi:hypothetical protein
MLLAKAIQQNAEIDRIPAKDIRRFLAQAMLSGRLDATKINLTAEVLAGIIKLIEDEHFQTR